MVSRYPTLGRPPHDRDPEALRQPLGRDPQVHLALPPDNDFVGFRIVDHRERGILVHQLLQRLAELDVVLALLGGDRDRQHRRQWFYLGNGGMRLLAGGERIAGLGPIELAERNRIAADRRSAFLVVLSDKLEHARHPADLAVGRIERGAVADLAGQHAHHRGFAAVGRVRRLEHVGDRLAVGLEAEALDGLGHAPGLVAQRLQQPQHAVGAGRNPHQHRADQAVVLLLGEIVEHLVARRRDVLEQLLHQLVVMVGERLQHGEARLFLAVERVALERNDLGGRVLAIDVGAFQREIDKTDNGLALPHRNLAQQQRHSRRRLQHLEDVGHAGVGFVDLVEEQKARDVRGFKFAQQQLQLRNLFLVGLAHHDRGVDRRQRGAHIVNELDRSRTVDEGVALVHERGGRGRHFHAHVVLARLLAGIAGRGPGVHRPHALDRSGPRQQRLQQRGLAALERPHQRNASGTGIGSRHVRLHTCGPSSGRPYLLCFQSRCVLASGGDLGRPRRGVSADSRKSVGCAGMPLRAAGSR